MKISYRWSTIPVLLLPLGSAAFTSLFERSAGATADLSPCYLWEQLPVVTRLSALLFLPSFPILVVQGLRNRSVPRWMSAACLLGFAGVLQHEMWRSLACRNRFEMVSSLFWAGTVVLMCVYQIFGQTTTGRVMLDANWPDAQGWWHPIVFRSFGKNGGRYGILGSWNRPRPEQHHGNGR